jgi:hypothetical protein
MNRIWLVLGLFVFGMLSCQKTGFITDQSAILDTTTDSLRFDTVFTSTGSITQFFKIYNRNDQKLRISSISLMGGNSSPYKINVDGDAGIQFNNIEMEANDSIYVFVSVTINPTAANAPFIAQDSIKINFNGKTKWVQLEAFGQNANYIRSLALSGNNTWTNSKPYVILGGMQILPNASLTIQQGTKVYVHADAPIIVDGTLITQGGPEAANRVVFKGDRLDQPYADFPASWPGIYFRTTSKNNVLQFTSILNAYQALVTENGAANSNPTVTLESCIIDNAYDAGIIALNSSIKASNSLISNCGKNIQLALGGIYSFTNCTNVAYSNSYILHKEPGLFVSNNYKQNNAVIVSPLYAQFTNCIFWGAFGTVDNEVVTSKDNSAVFDASFINCSWKVKSAPANATVNNMVTIDDPQFDSINTSKRYFDFHLKETSPLINKGASVGLLKDLDGKNRSVAQPDLGCYERQ